MSNLRRPRVFMNLQLMMMMIMRRRWRRKSDVANLRITNWKDCVRNRSKWKEFVEKAKTSPKL
jgi:hypothetical protein